MPRKAKKIPLVTIEDAIPGRYNFARNGALQFMATSDFGNRFRYQDEVVIEGFEPHGFHDGRAIFHTVYHLPAGQCIVLFERG